MDRLDRATLGATVGPSVALQERLFLRDRELKPVRSGLGDLVGAHTNTTRANRNVADTYPNAPLLKRLVLYPYVQDCARPIRDRGVDRSVPWELIAHVPVVFASAEAKASRLPLELGGPVRSHPRPAVGGRERPSAAAWLESAHE